jgi:type IV secretory pathway TrbL component
VFRFASLVGGTPLVHIFKAVMEHHGVGTTFSISETAVVEFGAAIEARYKLPSAVAYHNRWVVVV